ncbi:uncharacterized protein LOC106663162 [Cimex lectularius]|uniref:CPR type cuticle protein n=1 Tax=Cimex lectularius TaxID=79782 RepID=A0A8I6RH71_CIMLE|nr:uncharacterized protein LOC106663162 [Cimex lectularius]
MRNACFFSFLLLSALTVTAEPAGVVQALLEGTFGTPLFYRTQTVKFDSEVAKRRNPEFEAIHGHHSEYLIERFGLGEDGRQAERLQKQRQRDAQLYTNNY